MRIETRARNAKSILFPDVTGYRPDERAIAPGKPPLRGRAPFARLLGAARGSRVPTRLSRDAGRYLCNYVYWRALEASRSGTPLAQFIHIPPVASVPRRPGTQAAHDARGAGCAPAKPFCWRLLAAQRR